MHPTENYFYRMLLQQKIDFTCLVQQTLSRNNGEILCAGTYHLVSLFLIDADTVTKGEFSIEETGIIWTLLQKLDENPEDGLYEPEQLMELIRFASGKRVSFALNKEIALCLATDHNRFYDPGDIINRINLETLGKVCDWLAEAAESR